jgi:hypothetical protein
LRVESKVDIEVDLELEPPQIRKSFKSISFRAFYGTYFKAIKDKFKEQGLFKEMLVDAYGDRLPAEMLEELYDAGWLQLDHVVAATMDEPDNLFETSSVPDPDPSAFNCPGAVPSPPRHRRGVGPWIPWTHRPCPPQLMIYVLNGKFGRNTEQAFKKKHTGLGWVRAVNLIDMAIELQHSLGRL